MDSLSLCTALAATLIALGTARLLRSRQREPRPQCARHLTIDGLRGYLAFGVFLHHAAIWRGYLQTGQWAPPASQLDVHLGQSSVLLFFMITGFLFWTKLLDARARPICWSKFYLARLLRLAPLYGCAVVCLALIALGETGFHKHESHRALVGHIGQWLAFTLPGTPAINGFAETGMLLGVAWSLRYEWLFYALLPLGALLLQRSPGVRWLALSVAASTAILLAIPAVSGTMLLAFAGGMLAAVVARFEVLRRRLKGISGSMVAAAALLTAVGGFSSAYCLPVVTLLTVAFIIIACGNTLWGVLYADTSRTLGEMAYSIYLLHNFVLFAAFRLLLGPLAASLSPLAHGLVVACLVPILLLLCATAYRWIERPAMAAVPRCHAWMLQVASVLAGRGWRHARVVVLLGKVQTEEIGRSGASEWMPAGREALAERAAEATASDRM